MRKDLRITDPWLRRMLNPKALVWQLTCTAKSGRRWSEPGGLRVPSIKRATSVIPELSRYATDVCQDFGANVNARYFAL